MFEELQGFPLKYSDSKKEEEELFKNQLINTNHEAKNSITHLEYIIFEYGHACMHKWLSTNESDFKLFKNLIRPILVDGVYMIFQNKIRFVSNTKEEVIVNFDKDLSIWTVDKQSIIQLVDVSNIDVVDLLKNTEKYIKDNQRIKVFAEIIERYGKEIEKANKDQIANPLRSEYITSEELDIIKKYRNEK
jgi:hypothetical protein